LPSDSRSIRTWIRALARRSRKFRNQAAKVSVWRISITTHMSPLGDELSSSRASAGTALSRRRKA
jgi:hypothetical protein